MLARASRGGKGRDGGRQPMGRSSFPEGPHKKYEAPRLTLPAPKDMAREVNKYAAGFAALESFEKTQADQSDQPYYKLYDASERDPYDNTANDAYDNYNYYGYSKSASVEFIEALERDQSRNGSQLNQGPILRKGQAGEASREPRAMRPDVGHVNPYRRFPRIPVDEEEMEDHISPPPSPPSKSMAAGPMETARSAKQQRTTDPSPKKASIEPTAMPQPEDKARQYGYHLYSETGEIEQRVNLIREDDPDHGKTPSRGAYGEKLDSVMRTTVAVLAKPRQRLPDIPLEDIIDQIPHLPTPPKTMTAGKNVITQGDNHHEIDAPFHVQMFGSTTDTDFSKNHGRYSPRFQATEDGYVPYPPMSPQRPTATTNAPFDAVFPQSSEEGSEDSEVKQRNKKSSDSTDDDDSEGNQTSKSSSSKASLPPSISHSATQADTSSMGNDLSMEIAEEQDDEEQDDEYDPDGPIVDMINAGPVDDDIPPHKDDASAATEPQSNSFLTSANHYDNDGDPSDSSSSGSDDSVEMAERERQCPQPGRPFFHRYDVVVNIPKNSNPTETVATLIADVWNILMGIDVDVILYPYRASYELPALASPDALLMLGGGISTTMSTKENSTASRPGQYPIAGSPLRLAPEANRMNCANPPGTS